MNYYYDVLLNFQDKYYMFYEWDSFDTLDFVKKIPLFHVDSKTIKDFLTSVVVVDKEFLEIIKNKTKLGQNKVLEYTCIFADGKNSLAVEFDEFGLSISKSSLILDDELSINEFMYSIKETNVNYEVKYYVGFDRNLRQDIKIKKLLKSEIENIVATKNYSKLKYLYLEWFNKLDSDYNQMADAMLKCLDNNLTDKEYEIYKIVKMSYNNV